MLRAQEPADKLGTVQPPITGATPARVPGDDVVFQGLTGVLDSGNGSARGLAVLPPEVVNALFVEPPRPGGTVPVQQPNYTAIYGPQFGAVPHNLTFSENDDRGYGNPASLTNTQLAARVSGAAATEAICSGNPDLSSGGSGVASSASVCRIYIYTSSGGPTGGNLVRCRSAQPEVPQLELLHGLWGFL